MILGFGISGSIGSHQRRCCAATTTQMWSGSTTDAALCRVSASRDCPTVSEQNCLGTVTPEASVVKPCRRLPSPPASTMAQALLLVVMNYRSIVLITPARLLEHGATRPDFRRQSCGTACLSEPGR